MFWKKGNEEEEKIVEAIEDGKIVKVTEDYAKREGLLILRRAQEMPQQGFSEKMRYRKPEEFDIKKEKDRKMIVGMDDLRKPLRYREGDITKELIENFHWKISQKRRERGLTRKQVALAIGESENDIKIIENGVLPMNNFVLVSKLESYFGINLRKNKSVAPTLTKELNATRVRAVLQRVAEKAKPKEKKPEIIEDEKETSQEPKTEVIDFSGDEIELIGEDKPQ